MKVINREERGKEREGEKKERKEKWELNYVSVGTELVHHMSGTARRGFLVLV